MNEKLKLPDGWRSEVTMSDMAGIFKSYDRAVSDSVGVAGFLSMLQGGLVFIHDKAWVCFTDVLPGARATMHGGKFSVKDDVEKEFKEILNFIKEKFELKAFYALIPDGFSDAISLVKRHSFKEHGLLPFYDKYGGEFDNLMFFVKYMD